MVACGEAANDYDVVPAVFGDGFRHLFKDGGGSNKAHGISGEGESISTNSCA